MRAVVLSAPRSVELVNDWPEPEPGPQDVIVAIRGIGLCGSDLSVFDGTRPAPRLPWVMGHVGVGDIVAVGNTFTISRSGNGSSSNRTIRALRAGGPG